METDDGVFVLAVLGASPGVITELLWHLAVVQEATVVGVEIWTTSSERPPGAGLQALLSRYALFDRLGGEVAALRWLPRAGNVVDESGSAVLQEQRSPPQFRVVVFDHGGRRLGDVRNPLDAEVVERQLHDRLAFLTRTGAPPVVASLAGGRKTMSAALHSAMMVHGRPEDRLIHVLVHPEVERATDMTQFGMPDLDLAERLGVPVEEQVAVYDVPFPLLRRLGLVAEASTYDEVWGLLRQHAGIRAVVLDPIRDRQSSRLTWTGACGESLGHIVLPARQAEVLALLVDGPKTVGALTAAINGLRPSHHAAGPATEGAVQERLRVLRGRLGHALCGRPGLVPELVDGQWRIREAHLITVCVP